MLSRAAEACSWQRIAFRDVMARRLVEACRAEAFAAAQGLYSRSSTVILKSPWFDKTTCHSDHGERTSPTPSVTRSGATSAVRRQTRRLLVDQGRFLHCGHRQARKRQYPRTLHFEGVKPPFPEGNEPARGSSRPWRSSVSYWMASEGLAYNHLRLATGCSPAGLRVREAAHAQWSKFDFEAGEWISAEGADEGIASRISCRITEQAIDSDFTRF